MIDVTRVLAQVDVVASHIEAVKRAIMVADDAVTALRDVGELCPVAPDAPMGVRRERAVRDALERLASQDLADSLSKIKRLDREVEALRDALTNSDQSTEAP